MPKKQTHIDFKLNYDRLAVLSLMYESLLEWYEPQTDHDALLREHAIEMRRLIDEKLEKEQASYKIKLTSIEAMAFYQLWNRIDTNYHQYGNVVIGNLIEKIDKTSINAKIINNATR